VLGETRITVEASTSADASIDRVEIYVDGRLLSTLTRPPYTLLWNAGTRFVKRDLRAVAVDTLGRSAETTLVTRPLYIGQYEEVRLIDVYATVRDAKGRPVLDLGREDFTLLEDGRPQTISHFTSARVPLTVALLIDASNSMNLGGKIDLARRAAEEFVKSAEPEDRMMVLAFNDRVAGLTEPVSDRRRLEESIEAIRASGGTALYDALFRAAELLTGVEGRRAIVLLSDGRDQALADNEPGSLHLFEEALERVHRSDVSVYSVGLGHHLDQELTLDGARSLEDVLRTLARQTGGRYYNPDRPSQLSQVYRQIVSDLKDQYLLAYTSTNTAHDGRWRSITLRVRPPDLQVQARAGYYAPGPDGP
ncbi:MAG TPA: VWA domain-containing protein, partial [Candidatus Polarisedimenticolia bacterium]|nr:VWA domain-containing protein [Candidatus Polarisedimenticolia bacterium]